MVWTIPASAWTWLVRPRKASVVTMNGVGFDAGEGNLGSVIILQKRLGVGTATVASSVGRGCSIQFGIFPSDGLQRELRGTLFLVLGVFGLRLGFSLAPLRSISRPKPLVFWGFLFWPFQWVESTESSLEKIKRQLTSGSGRYLLQGPLLKRSETVWLLGSLVVLEIHASVPVFALRYRSCISSLFAEFLIFCSGCNTPLGSQLLSVTVVE
ncbi:hypothetical protein BHE74_00022200 [Ensete ventricosum]|nr:hypothetical protein BHE74_00022200 [Ensete ventricosum]